MTHSNRRVFVAATYDTKGQEAEYVVDLLRRDGVDVVSVDVSTTGAPVPLSSGARRRRQPPGRGGRRVHR